MVDDGPFTHGVGSFDPTDSSVLLWTRAPGAEQVRWYVAPATDVAPVASGEIAPPPDQGGSVAVEVDDLVPATAYRYWFEVDGRRSPMGRTRTLPASGHDPFRIAVVCCADWERGHFGVYRAVAEAEVDLVVHLGDYIYETAGRDEVRSAAPAGVLVTPADYRTRYAQSRSDPDLQALHRRHPMVAVWDDHDIVDNAWRHGAKEHDPDAHGPWEDRLAAATRAWHEWLPTRRRDPSDPLAIWRSLIIGDLAEIVLLDTRIAGRDEHADHEDSPALRDPRRSLLGDAQRAWAHDRARDTTRPWCVLASSVVLNRMHLPVPGGDLLSEGAPSGYAVVDGEALCTDEWDGYPAERDALVGALADRGGGAVVVSGDVHASWAFEGPCTADGDPVAVELVVPCVSSTPMARHLPGGWRGLADGLAGLVPEATWFDLERHGYVVVQIEEDRVTADWRAADPEGLGGAAVESLAVWAHRRDRPGRLEHAAPSGPLDPGTAGEPKPLDDAGPAAAASTPGTTLARAPAAASDAADLPRGRRWATIALALVGVGWGAGVWALRRRSRR